MRRSESWTLADVLDFEALVAADERADDPEAVARRDAQLWREKIAPALGPDDASDRSAVFHQWLLARRGEGPQPGSWLLGGWRISSSVAALAGLLLGFVIAGGALYYAGARPVNVAVFLAVTVGVQWLFLAWTLLLALTRGLRAASGRLSAQLGERLSLWLACAADHLSGEQRLRLRAEAGLLRQLAGRNLQLLRWPPWLALQGFGIAWNVGALAALLLRVLFTDVTFGWESTAAQGPHGTHHLAQTLAAPWTWFAPDGCPTLEQVEKSWFHYQSGIAALEHDAMRSWWPWLTGVILVYGLLPRSALWLWFWSRLHGVLRRVSFDEPRHRAVWHRLTGPVIRGESAPHEKLPPSVPPPGASTPRRIEPGCVLIASALTPAQQEIERWVAAQFGWQMTAVETVEIDFPSGNDAPLARLAAAIDAAPRWLIVVPAPFTAFTALAQFIERLRSASPTMPHDGYFLIVSLDDGQHAIEPTAEWARYWRDFVQAELPGCATLPFTP